MLPRWILASLHLLGFGLGSAFTADNFWGISALVLLSTGMARVSYLQTELVLALLALATGMARGIGS